MNRSKDRPGFLSGEGPQVCISVQGRDQRELASRMKEAFRHSLLVELRLDGVQGLNIDELLGQREGEVILAFRAASQGGKFLGPDSERLKVLMKGAGRGAGIVDLELETAEKSGGQELVRSFKTAGAKVLLSFHDFRETPSGLEGILKRLLACFPDAVKISTQVRSWQDNLRLIALLKDLPLPGTVLGMGEKGMVTRILGKKYGSSITYAALREDEATAPGQLALSTLRELYQWERITAKTAIYGIVGHPLSHSLSPLVHNLLFSISQEEKVYIPFPAEDLADFFEMFQGLNGEGLSVTHPHKAAVLSFIDQLGGGVERVGGANTVVRKGGKTMGYNTDGFAASVSLAAFLSGDERGHCAELLKKPILLEEILKGRKIAVLGAGGAARAVAWDLKSRGAVVTLFNRTLQRGEKASRELGIAWGGRILPGDLEAEVIINATPVGMYPEGNALPMDPKFLEKGQVVYDLIYNPRPTLLLREASKRGCRTLSGLGMFLVQALLQHRLFTGREPDEDWFGLLYKRCSSLLGGDEK